MSDTDPAGWQPDPTGRHDHRYWDGAEWTDNVSDAGVASTDAYSAAPEPTVADTAPAAPTWDAPTTVTPPPPTDSTATWGTTPGAPIPPMPPPVTAGPTGGGSKRGLLIGLGILALVALAVVAFLALSGDDDDSEVRAELIAGLTDEDRGDLSQDDAECAADVFIDEIGAEKLAGIDLDDDDVPEALEDEFNVAYERAVRECDIDVSDSGAGEETTGSDDTFPEDANLPPNFEDILADTYESTFDISRDKAECLAEKLSEAIEGGSLAEEEAMSEIFDYLAACDISMSEIGAN